MPPRRPRARKAGGKPSTVLRPGVSSHSGIYQEKDVEKQPSLRRTKSFFHRNREEGVLYTVKVAERHSVDSKGGTAPPPQSDQSQTKQYTISKQRKHVRWNPFRRFCHSFGVDLIEENVDSFLYKPSKPISAYINWTFYADFFAVFLSFLAAFFVLCLVFAALFALVGHFKPECIVVSGEEYTQSKLSDAFALSWTTFTTVGYGNTYPATGHDFDVLTDSADDCGGVVFLCTFESFLGLIYAGMCAAILFGKVNRIQSHAHLTFANAVCLQFEDVDLNEFVDDDLSDSDCDNCASEESDVDEGDDERRATVRFTGVEKVARQKRISTFKERFRGCPVLKFQVMNDFCNKVGGEIVDGVMKVVGIKMKTRDGKITHSQYVRVATVDFEHPFFGRVWHGVHILDSESPLLTKTARDNIDPNKGWPEEWFKNPDKIRRKLDFHSLIVTVSGISNVSACTVHAYKRYKFKDVIIGFDFAPLVYFNESKEKLEVDTELVHDVLEQQQGRGEDLVEDDKSEELIRKGSTLFHRSTH